MPVVSVPFSGQGITLSYKVGLGSYIPITLIKDDSEFSGFENMIIELKTLSAGVVTKIVGRTDSGSFSGSAYLVNADLGISQLFSLFASKVTTLWQVQLPDGATNTTGTAYQFVGPISKLQPGNFTGEDAPTLSFEIAISGFVTIVAAT